MRVYGGMTGAGTRKPLRSRPDRPWTCKRGHVNKSYWASCMTGGCHEKRP